MRILIDRKIGGFGDLMMLSTPMAELMKSNEVGIVLHPKWHGLFKYWKIKIFEETPSSGWDEIVNIHAPCPASMMEVKSLEAFRVAGKNSRTMVQVNRIEAFASAMQVDLRGPIIPKVVISKTEEEWARHYVSQLPKPVVYVQCDAAECYKAWFHFDLLCDAIEATGGSVIVNTQCGHRKPLSCDILMAIALMGQCDLVVSVDSMAIHAATAMNRPSVLISGPMNPGSRIETYPYASAVTAAMPCVPCWRNQNIPCHLSNSKTSTCLTDLPIEPVSEHVLSRLRTIGHHGVKEPVEKYHYVYL